MVLAGWKTHATFMGQIVWRFLFMLDADPDDTFASVDVLASDFLARYRDGDRPTIDEYVRRHPELAAAIQKMFPLVLSVEKVKIDQQVSGDGTATLAGRSPKQLGDFRLIREIGRGGMGVVFEAMQESLGRMVAVKLLPKQSLLDDAALRRFQREAKTAAAMHHTNIVPVFGTGEADGTSYLVMQLVQGETLDKKITEAGASFDFRRASLIAKQIADALDYAHHSGVLHRDVKPANILLDENDTAQITDFGLARNRQDDLTMTQALSGSPRYMAPERFQGLSDERSDIYSLGLTLYEMLTGEPAFVDSDPHQLMESVRQHRVKSVRLLRPDVPLDLETIVSKAMNPEASLRYQTAASLRDDLNRFLLDQPIQARRISPLSRCLRWCRRNPRIAASAGIALASLSLATLASTAGWVIVSQANQRTAEALRQSEQTVDVALLSLDGVVDIVAAPSAGIRDTGFDDSGFDNSGSPILRLNPSPHTAKVLESIQPLYERLSQQSPSRPDVIVQMIRASIRLALIQQQLGQTSAAIDSLDRGLQVLLTRSEMTALPENEKQRLLASLYNELAAANASAMRFDESEAASLEAITAAMKVPASDREAQLQLARAHVALGAPASQRRRVDSSSVQLAHQQQREHLNAAHEILEQLHQTPEEGGTVQESRGQGSLLEVLRAQVRLAESRLAKRPGLKQDHFAEAIKIFRRQLDATPDDTAVRFRLVEALAGVNLRREVRTPRQRNEARMRLRESLDELAPLRRQFPDTTLFAVAEVHVWHKLSNIARSAGDLSLASEHLDNAMRIQTQLVEESPENMTHRCWRALLYRSVAEIGDLQGDTEGKLAAIENASADLDAIAPSDQDQPFVLQTRQRIEELVLPDI
ncbi:Serine/threonine-protein kinase PknB [Roseimaritima multifibrata]|uniref:Serine/threonine-protein kinase PknB n=2 Tax=Roseimaritima multifibrata TaxID=1930274 RepID=A0A517MMA2_9BACT|nr:Serine/threonine-protein kinase PknB [Roseimaritima multifibrata]